MKIIRADAYSFMNITSIHSNPSTTLLYFYN
jgi:hypothetical protein